MLDIKSSTLVKRINRTLAVETQILRKTRGQRARLDLGDYYIHDRSRNLALDTYVDPESLGRELGVLNPHESVID